jgi:hypothetical protein
MSSSANKRRPNTKSRQRADAGVAVDMVTSGALLDALFDEVRHNGHSEHARDLVQQLRQFAAAGDLLAQAMIDRAAVPC